jgi:hypothetical protein
MLVQDHGEVDRSHVGFFIVFCPIIIIMVTVIILWVFITYIIFLLWQQLL